MVGQRYAYLVCARARAVAHLMQSGLLGHYKLWSLTTFNKLSYIQTMPPVLLVILNVTERSKDSFQLTSVCETFDTVTGAWHSIRSSTVHQPSLCSGLLHRIPNQATYVCMYVCTYPHVYVHTCVHAVYCPSCWLLRVAFGDGSNLTLV